MGVSKELFGNNVGRVALDGLVVEVRPVHDTVSHRGANMANDPDTVAGVLGGLQLCDEPLQFTVGIIVILFSIKVEVHGVAEVGIEGDDTESGGGANIVGTIVALDRVDSVRRQPAGPVVSQAVIQPLDTSSRGGSREEIGRSGLVVSDGGVDLGSQGSHYTISIGGLGYNGLLSLSPDIMGWNITSQDTERDIGDGRDVGHHVLTQLDGNIAMVVAPGRGLALGDGGRVAVLAAAQGLVALGFGSGDVSGIHMPAKGGWI